MVNLSQIKRDVTAETAGVEVPFVAPGIEAGIVLRIARWQNPAYRRRVDELAAPFRASWKNGDVPEETVNEIVDRAASECILVGWSGVEEEDENGALQPVPYSHAKAYEYMHDALYSDVRAFVLEHSQRSELYRLAARKKSLGNSAPSSNGSEASGTVTPS